jgi:alpha-L-rhamnosidase
MNSHNHLMLVGDLITWLYEDLAGIAPDPVEPGFKRLVMRPHPVAGLEFCKASHETLYGPVASEWKRDGANFSWKIVLPPNTTATVYVPTADAKKVEEGRGPAAHAPGVRFLRSEPGRAVYAIQSGTYQFVAPQ